MFSYFMKPRPPRKDSVGHSHSLSTSQDDQALNEQVANDGQQEHLGGSCVKMQHDISPATVTGHQAESSKPDQDEHEKEVRDRKRTHYLEGKLATEIDRYKRLEAMLAKMLQEKEAELTNIKDIAYRQEQTIHELLAASQRHSNETNQTREELHHVTTKYQHTNQLLQKRTEELTTAQQFLGKTDRISPMEVVRLVEALNGEIAQQSNFILDLLTYRKWTGSANDLEHLLKGLRGLLGPWLCDNLCRRLIDPDLEFDPLLTQLAFQTGLINACKFIINRWCPPFPNDASKLDRIHGEMGRKVGQVIAGKWRALSSTYLGVDREKNKERLRNLLLKLITAVGGSAQSGDTLLPDLRSKVDEITRKALEIHEYVRCSVTSMDLEVYSVPCGTQFHASQMEDSDGPSRGKGKTENNRQGKVICTLEMGLRYKKKVPTDKQGEFRDEMGIILKSKVVLDDAFALQITES